MRAFIPALVAFSMSSAVHATTTFDSGGMVTTNTPIPDDVVIENGTDVTLEPGGDITAPTASVGVTVNDISSLSNAGGSAAGGSGENGGNGVDIGDASTFEMSTGSVTGGDATGILPLTGRAGAGLNAQSSAPNAVSITGGSITGGNGTDTPGAGAVLTDTDGSISGGSFKGGDANGALEGAPALLVDGASLVSIFDGIFVGGDGGSNTGGDALVVGGTSIVDLFGGEFEGGSGDEVGGNGIALADNAMANIYGGDIRDGIDAEQNSVVTFFGYDLAFDTGIVTGFFRSRTRFSINVTVGGNAQVVLSEVAPIALPTPALMMMAGIGALAVTAWAGKRHKRSH